jgi:hypothetical protein
MKKGMMLSTCLAMIMLLGFFVPNVEGWTSVQTNCPSAYGFASGANGWIEYPSEALIADMDFALLRQEDGLAKFLATNSFTNPAYGFLGPQPLPPDNATIISVELTVRIVMWASYARTFTLQYATNETNSNVTSETATWHSGSNGTQGWAGAGPAVPAYYFVIFYSDVTSLEAWTPALLKDPQTWVRIYTDDGATSHELRVDYVGFAYTWTADLYSPPGPPPSADFSMSMVSPIGLFGIIGFVGMVSVPAASIWFFKHDQGGSKIYAGVMALVAFTVCAGLFLASIQGG